MSKPLVVVLGPKRDALGGVSTHLKLLLGAEAALNVEFQHFEVGSQGRGEAPFVRALRLLASPFAFAAMLFNSGRSIVHFNTSLDNKAYWRDSVYMLVARLLGRPILCQVHGGELPAEFFGNNRILAGLLRRVLGLPHTIVLLADEELRAYRNFVPEARAIVIANAIDASDLAMVPAEPTEPCALRLLYMSRLEASKGVFELLQAIEILRERNVDVSLSVVGAGSAGSEMRSWVEWRALGRHVQFHGALSGKAKLDVMRKANVFVLPTYHKEGLPYALLEGMALGMVPVTCAVGAIPDVVQHEKNGVIVPPRDPYALADALQRLHRDKARLKELARESRQRVLEHYTLPRMVGDFRTVYQAMWDVS